VSVQLLAVSSPPDPRLKLLPAHAAAETDDLLVGGKGAGLVFAHVQRFDLAATRHKGELYALTLIPQPWMLA
jgi:hypothetical protein